MSGAIGTFVDNTYVYASEVFNHRTTRTLISTSTTTVFAGNNGQGNGLNQLNFPWGIYVDTTSTMYIADQGNHRIVRWVSGASSGTVVAGATGVAGSNSTLLDNPCSVILDSAGLMYVMDFGNRRVQRFTIGNPVGTTILSFSVGLGANQISAVWQLYLGFDPTGNLYISDAGGHRVQRHDLTCPTTTTSTTTTTSAYMMFWNLQ